MDIRKMTEADIPLAVKIDTAAFSKSWRETDFADELKKDYARYYICLSDSAPVGYVGIWCIYETAELIRIAAAPQGQGIGGALLDRAICAAKKDGCERMLLEVRRGNLPAIGLYKSRGFNEISVRRGYYDGEDAIIMERII